MYAYIELYILVFACTGSLSEFLEIENVQCKTRCSNSSTAAVLNKDQNLTCSIINPVPSSEDSSLIPWSNKREKTAYLPKNLQLSWYIYKNKKIAINITWLQKVSELETGYIEGYFLEIGLLKYDANIEIKSLLLKNNISHKNYIQFNFQCYGTSRVIIKPEEKIEVKLYSKPIYSEDSHEQALEKSVAIPSCFEDERLSRIRSRFILTRECKEYWRRKRKERRLQTVNTSKDPVTMIDHLPQPDHTIYYALASVIGATTIIVLLLMIVQRRNKRTKSYKKGRQEILMVADCHDNEELDSIHTLATKLRDEYLLEIKCNWENQSEIAQDSLAWYQNTIKRTNMIIFIINYECFKDGMSATNSEHIHPELRQALNYANARSLQSRAEIIFLLTGYISTAQLFSVRRKTHHKVYSMNKIRNGFMQQVMKNNETVLQKTEESSEESSIS